MASTSAFPVFSLPVTLKLATLTFVTTFTLSHVGSSPLPGATSFHFDLNPYIAESCDVISFVAHGFEVPGCSPTKNETEGWGVLHLGDRAACPWMSVTDVDPLRIPRVLHYAKCKCMHSQGTQSSHPCCKEHHVTIPVVHCDRDPETETPSVCRMTYKRVTDSCVCSDMSSTRVQ